MRTDKPFVIRLSGRVWQTVGPPTKISFDSADGAPRIAGSIDLAKTQASLVIGLALTHYRCLL